MKFLVACLLAFASSVAFADEQKGLTLYPHFGKTFPDSDSDIQSDIHYGLGIGYRFDNPWAIELVYQQADLDLDAPLTGDVDVDSFRLDGLYHFRSQNDVSPYLSFGVGTADYDFAGGDDDETLLNVGFGMKWFFSEKGSMRAEAKLFRGNDEDVLQSGLSLGLHYALGGSSGSSASPAPSASPATAPGDEDGDGVLDDADRCPGTPAGVQVDRNGCPLDDDSDGVANYMDDCPNTTNRRARVDARGCYIMLERRVDISLDVEFDFDSSDARPEHRPEVKRVADFMDSYPKTSVTMEGHTDSTGDANYNQGLSERRAKTIADMLVNEFGIESGRVSARGYGESKPIATNETQEGRQKNRRVVGVVEATQEEIKMK